MTPSELIKSADAQWSAANERERWDEVGDAKAWHRLTTPGPERLAAVLTVKCLAADDAARMIDDLAAEGIDRNQAEWIVWAFWVDLISGAVGLGSFRSNQFEVEL